MDEATRAEVEAATAYEDLLVQSLLGEWAPRVADAAELAAGHRVLDVACGTGVLAREAQMRVGPEGSVAGLDPGAGMLSVASRLSPSVAWKQGFAEKLPFDDGAFDRVVSQFGLMVFRDRVRSVAEMLRVATPGGIVAVAVWDSIENIPAYAASAALIEEIAGKDAADCVRVPFALGNPEAVHDLFQQAGSARIRHETGKGTARFPSLRSMMEADLRGWLPVLGVELEESVILDVLSRADHVLAEFVTPRGELVFESSAHIFTATN